MLINFKKIISQTINIILIITLIFLAAVFITTKISGGPPEVFGHQLKVVLSGSMEPAFKTGSIIAVKSGGDMTRFQAGEVITFVDGTQKIVITHRVLDVVQREGKTFYKTKGDNNQAADINLVSAENVLGVWTGLTIPYAGYILHFINSKMGIIALLIIPGILLLLYSLLTVWGTASQQENEPEMLPSKMKKSTS